MNCPACKQTNTGDRSYCGACGTAFVRYCTRCGFRNATADRYCGGCGAALDTTPSRSPVPDTSTGPGPEPLRLPSAGDDLAELLAAAREGKESEPEDPGIRVSQGDIDSLFGE